MFARGLKGVFSVIEFVDKAASCIVPFQCGEVFAVAGLIGGGGFFLLFGVGDRLLEVGQPGLCVDDGLEFGFSVGHALNQFYQVSIGVLVGIDGDCGEFGAALADFQFFCRMRLDADLEAVGIRRRFSGLQTFVERPTVGAARVFKQNHAIFIG